MTLLPRAEAGSPYRKALALAALLGAASACGQVGPPLPPLRSKPAPPLEMQIAQHGPRLSIRYRAPSVSVDGLRLPVLDVDLVWLAGEGNLMADGKHVLRRVAPGEMISEGLDPAPLPGTSLRALATARSGKHVSVPTAIVTHTVEVAPATPAGLTVERLPAGVRVRWSAVEASRSRVYRRSEGETTAGPLAADPTPPNTASYDDVSPGAALAGCYTVRAVSATSAVVESEDSEEACVAAPAATPLDPPAGLAVVGTGDAVDLSWSPSSDPRVVRYRIYRAGGGAPEIRGETEGAQTTFRDLNPPRGERLVYTVTALGQDGSESAASSPAATRVRGQ